MRARRCDLPNGQKRVFVDFCSCYTSGGEVPSGDDAAAAAATHRSHRRALALVREAVALADRQLFDRNLGLREPDPSEGYERLGSAKLPLGRVTDYAPPEQGPQRYMGHNEYIVYDAARHRIKYVVQCCAA